MQLKGNRMHLNVLTDAGFWPGLQANRLLKPRMVSLMITSNREILYLHFILEASVRNRCNQLSHNPAQKSAAFPAAGCLAGWRVFLHIKKTQNKTKTPPVKSI